MASHHSVSPVGSYDEKSDLEPESSTTVSRSRHSWFRSVFFQATVVGMCAFLSPGIWNSSAGGGQEPYLVNAANSLVFGLMVFTCLLAGTITNKISYRWAVVLGTAGYAPYAAGLYLNKTRGTVWLVLFGSACCGLSAGLFWGVEDPEARKRGRYLAYWLAFRNGGQLLGGIISLALNTHASGTGSVGTSTYVCRALSAVFDKLTRLKWQLVFIALQAFAPVLGVLVSNPAQVRRPDNTKVEMENNAGFVTEMKEMWSIIKRREVLFLIPISLYAQWSSSYAGTFLSLYFSVRSRALAAFLVAVLGVIVNGLLGAFLDNTSVRMKVRSRASYIFIMSVLGGVWIWFTVLQVRYDGTEPKYDWTDGGAWAAGFVLYLVFYSCYYVRPRSFSSPSSFSLCSPRSLQLLQNELYWLISQLARQPTEVIRLSSFLRALESAGSACAFGVSASKHLPKTVPVGINFGLWAVSTLTAWGTVREIGVAVGPEV
ncbi:SPOSA6832_04434 [Sporobolomyces salmonicolor]|uniref:SPOSA6832_04434-mRNA-1:cds n=1 Tax=Sporidiobolus salmonicolor TaxID=5005 RepID=A0A0D6ES34_SPOSA|nr:SPOSA6832_04434 [Sporobolomyces salmonicolor]